MEQAKTELKRIKMYLVIIARIVFLLQMQKF